MKIYQLKRVQVINVGIKEAWGFFSSPRNLNNITPPYLEFDIITTDLENVVYEGMLIEYRIKPLFNIRMRWVTEIKSVEPPTRFLDEQRFGPYRFWHHQHLFRQISDTQTEMTDVVHYAIGYGFLGKFMNKILIENRLEKIFDYRFQIVERLFNTEEDGVV